MTSGLAVRCGAVAVAALRGHGDASQVLLLRRSKGVFGGLWCLVTGRIEPEELAWRTALRELREEAGLVPDVLYSADCCDQFYNPVENLIEVVPFFVARLSVDAQVTLNHENTSARWAGLKEAIEVVPFSGHAHALSEVWNAFVDRPPQDWMKLWTAGDAANGNR